MSDSAMIAGSIVVFAVQMILCLKVKSLWVRLIPAVALAVQTVLCGVLYPLTANWAWFIIALIVGSMLIPCGLGWIVGSVFRKK